MSEQRRVLVVETRQLSPSVRELALRCVDGQPLAFTAGQWVHIHVETDEGVLKRAYSIASPPSADAPDRFTIAVTRVAEGPVSSALHAVRPGQTLEMDGPHGFFTLDTPPPALFVGTGTGVAPLRSMLGDALRQDPGFEATLLFGCRTAYDILWRDELEAWARDHPGFHLEISLSRPDAGWPGRKGYVQQHLRELLVPYGMAHVYVCGLSKMVSEVRRVLKGELGYDRKHIHSERYD